MCEDVGLLVGNRVNCRENLSGGRMSQPFVLVSLAATASESGHTLLEYLKDPNLLLTTLLTNYGAWMIAIVAIIVFIESGVLFPVLPGDSMVFALGILHSQIPVPLIATALILVTAAILGNIVGYGFGVIFGQKLFSPDARFLKTEYLVKAQEFFNRYGGRALVLARFVPFVRTFVPIVAGMARFRWFAFLIWNILGAILWVVGFLVAGVLLGDIPIVRDNVEIIALIIVIVSVLPMLVGVVKNKLHAKHK